MKWTVLLFFLLVGPIKSSFGQACSAAASIPADQTKLGGGTATVHYDGTTMISGGQNAYVKISNQNVLGVSYELTIARNANPVQTVCTYKAILPPKASAILYGGFIAVPPVSWKVTVAVGSESDAGVLTYEVYSKPVQDTPICATANEGGTATLSCPGGKIVGISFASYGTPNGSCTRFSYGSCHSQNSTGVLNGRCIGGSVCSVPATNNVFGDPCVGTVKRLYVQATCRK